jgi:DNA-binding transcriptional LysR family regulator
MVYLSQPTVSSHIKDLENHFECKLVDRLGREVAPTRAGTILYSYAKKIIALKQEAENALAEFQGEIKGHLSIGGSTIPGGYILPPLLGQFKKDYPDVVVTLIEGDTARVVQDTLAGTVELGVVGAKERQAQLVQKKIMNDEMFLIVPADHKWGNRRQVTMDEVIQESFIMRELGSGTRKSIERVFEASGFSLDALNVVAEMGSTEAVRQGIKAGVGVSILSRLAVAEELALGRLKKVKMKGLSFKRAFYLIYHRRRTQSPLCRAFIEFLNLQADLEE